MVRLQPTLDCNRQRQECFREVIDEWRVENHNQGKNSL